ncbi:NADPH quinone reductase MdaB [candidate division LCP-89 bacterium B3_LCP]|uniref:NADPH quinone reductase MdaB n=1 Tax=candidate division LCP-89 bacterium B3_LCP TaxID=2012998 RepID=A0A532UZP3_UNCL8|nr:MAG: NADPH quinone reductase MdaB [candidate division LCP-89 bacterium B3_LCP]
MKNVLLINAHQRYAGFAEGKLNQTLIDSAQVQLNDLGYETKTTIVESGYDVAEELGKYKWADVVIVQTPVYWMSVPYIFKKYIDEVFTAGIGEVLCTDDGRTRSDLSKKYGSGGLMSGKKYMISTTWNAPLEAFEDPNQFFEGKGLDGVFFWLHKAFQFFDMQPLESFACHNVLKAPEVENDLKRFKEHLDSNFVK